MYGEGAVTDQMCQKWSVKFHAGDLSLDDAPQPGRPVEVDSDQIETLIENNQCYTMWEVANILKISRSINLLVKMKKCLLAILILKIEENRQHFWHIMLYYFKENKNATEMQKKKRFVQCMEKVL